MSSVKFDNVEIINDTYMTQFVKHESVAERELFSLPIANGDGDIYATSRYGKKIITLKGTIFGSSQSDCEDKIDIFTELFSREQKNLDIAWNGVTHRYIATCRAHTFDRDHFHINAVPWEAEFIVPTGYSTETTETSALLNNVLNSTSPVSDTFNLLGSKVPKPVITIQGNNFSTLHRGVEYKNNDTGEKIVFTYASSIGNTKSIVFDCLKNKVTSDVLGTSKEFPFYGVFPQFKIGSNSVQITCGGIVNQETRESSLSSSLMSGYQFTSNSTYMAQSFSVPYTDSTFQGVTLALAKYGSPTGGNVVFRIETDNNDAPSGTLAHANASGFLSYSTLTTSYAYFDIYSANTFKLNANTKYWLVFYVSGGVDDNNTVLVGAMEYSSNFPKYPRGTDGSLSTNDGATYSHTSNSQFIFKVRYGGKPDTSSIKHTVKYYKTYL